MEFPYWPFLQARVGTTMRSPDGGGGRGGGRDGGGGGGGDGLDGGGGSGAGEEGSIENLLGLAI